MEACPFCRRVREALTELDLSAEVYPCPKGSRVHRAFVKASGGKEQFPFLLDPNTGVSMDESSDIVNYLFQEYGERRRPTFGILERLVREALCELELPYILWNMGKGSLNCSKLKQISGSTQVPYLVDPNTGIQMAESLDIIRYLFANYNSKKEAFGASPGRFSATAGNELKVGRFEVLESKDELDLIGQQPPESLRQFNQRFQSYIRPNLIREQDTVSWDKFCPIRDAETAC
ncbi:hypothetical protein SELMODRAFT_440314 [Selaginella moellendorffii]|uniref:GST N-terminal domain-containing protein n=1 Tax=Selaginella moellendorffii TaxID=88036 RepID=D8RAY2_SELML|nr:hypothetical protein SELMODRAFT_440314 [Selaginella moellendorffii]